MYTPLTPQQFQAAQKAGFTTDQIIANEKIRQQQENQPVPNKFGTDVSGHAFNPLNANAQQNLDNITAGTKQGVGANFASNIGKLGISRDSYAPIPNPIDMAKGFAEPVLKGAATAARAVQSTPALFTGQFQKANQIMSKPIFGQNTAPGSTPLQNVGSALNAGSNLIGLGGELPAIFGGQTGKAIFTGALQGATQGAGGYLSNENNPTLAGVAGATAQGTLSGGVTGGVAAKIQPIISNNPIDNFKSLKEFVTNPVKITQTSLAKSLSIKQANLIDERLGLNNNTKQAINQRKLGDLTGSKTPGQVLMDNKIPFNDSAIPLLDEHIAITDATRRALLESEGKYGSLDEAANQAKSNLKLQGTDRAKAERMIDQELVAYKGQYSQKGYTDENGKFLLPQHEMDNVKSGLYKQSYGKGITNNDSIANQAKKSFASSIKNSIEASSESKVVQALNRQEGDFINAKKMLDGKNIEQLIKPSKTGALGNRIVGGIIGSHFGPLGTIAGEVIGGRVGEILNRVPENIRQSIIDNLSKTPEGQSVLEKAQQTVSNRQEAQSTRPRLGKGPITPPAPVDRSSMTVTSGPTMQQLMNTKSLPSGNGQKETIFAGPRTDQKIAKVSEAKTSLPGRNPKTGRMFRTYSSSSK